MRDLHVPARDVRGSVLARHSRRMGGIAGFHRPALRDQAQSWLEEMIRVLRHRGPHGFSFHVDGPVGLSSARDSRHHPPSGSGPIAEERRDVAIACDADIVNLRELRDRLEARGHRFQTSHPESIIARLYEEEGERFVEELEGHFAIAIWDARRQRLLLARDRMGARPLHYAEASGGLWFGSEIKALLAVLPECASLSIEGLAQAFTYWAPLEPTTAFRNVRSLPAGHLLLVDEGGKRLQRYWDWSFPRAEDMRKSTLSLSQATSELRDRLLETIAIQMRADAKIGAYLSGGLDSSGIVALMSISSAAKVHTFSIAFDEKELDESAHQREVAAHFGTEHSVLRCSRRDIANAFPRLIRHTEAPIVRTAPAPLLLLSAHVRDAGYDMVLTGEGADEVFAGYDLFKEAMVRRFWARQPASTCRPRLLERLYPYLEHSPTTAPAFARAFFGKGMEHVRRPIFAHLPRWSTSARALSFFSEALRTELTSWDPLEACERMLPAEIEGWEPLARYQYVEARTLLSHLLSSQGDRVSMANGLRARLPYLDHRIIELASRFPSRFKLRGLSEKHVLRRALGGLLPKSVAERPKQPYRAPESISFFFDGKAVDYVNDLLGSEQLRKAGYFDPIAVERLREKCRTRCATSFSDNQAFVGILSTMLLHETFVRRR